MTHHFLIRYGEIGLKGLNQRFFLDTLARRVEEAVADLAHPEVRIVQGRLIVTLDAPPRAVADRLRRVFGVVSLSPARVVPPTLQAITDTAVEVVGEALADRPETRSFKVDTRRADKHFVPTSMETSSHVGGAIQRRYPQLQARMHGPDMLVWIEIRDQAYLSTETIPGPGGLPVGTSGRALALLSGGIDSPVAAWLGARRGLTLIPVHFHSFPFTSERAKDKVVDLCQALSAYAGALPLWIVHFTEIQRAIQLHVPESFRVLVMRRMMMRIADALAEREDAQALITGESLGQVASQTIESIAVIEAATRLPVLRPLIGWDKTEIVSRATELGTYEISIRPYADCCSLFLPAHPRTQPLLHEVIAAERELDIASLVPDALARSVRTHIRPHTLTSLSTRA